MTMVSVSEYGPTAFERASYYNGITGNGEHPTLIYRTDALTRPFDKPTGRFFHLPVKSLRGVFGTALNKVWDIVSPQIRDILKAWDIPWCSIDTARFFTHSPPGEEKKGILGPVVVWIGVKPGLTSPDTAHSASQEILAVLKKNGVEDVEVEWREEALQRLVDSSSEVSGDSHSSTSDHMHLSFQTP